MADAEGSMADADEDCVMHVLRGRVRERGNPVQISNRDLGLAVRVLGLRLRGALDRLEARGAIRRTGRANGRWIEVLDHAEAGG